MKKIGVCVACRRKIYTNEDDLCKRCSKDVDVDIEED